MKNLFLFFIFCLAILTVSCIDDKVDIEYYTQDEFNTLNRELQLPETPFDYTINLPDHLNEFGVVNSFEGDPHSLQRINDNHLITLGRVLFYDQSFSKNETVSCASCHDQKLAFADDVALSEGFEGELTNRNSLALASTPGFESSYGSGQSFGISNVGFSWDEGIRDLRGQSRAAFLSEVEMGMTMDEIVEKIRNKDFYDVLFTKAFGDNSHFGFDVQNEDNVLIAIERFVNSISSTNSKFDEGLSLSNDHSPFNNFENFTDSENRGKTIFMNACISCHSEKQNIVFKATANNGLDLVSTNDLGVAKITGESHQEGHFKVPLLRNVGLTAPYMHDGRFATLEEVIDHYSEGVKNHPNLSPELKDFVVSDGAIKMNFSASDKRALVDFLHTMTDPQLMDDERFSDPFKR